MLHALARQDLEIAYWGPPGGLPQRAAYLASPEDEAFLRAVSGEGGLIHLLRNRPVRGIAVAASYLHRLGRVLGGTSADVLHLNWLQNALPLPRHSPPALVTALGSDVQLLRLPGMKGRLRRKLQSSVICPNARWMEQPLSSLAPQVSAVEFGVDNRWYELERQVARAPRRWLLVARLTHDKIGPLFDWGKAVFDGTTDVLELIGPNQDGVEIPPWVRYHGPAGPDRLHAEFFPAASGLVSLSRHAEGKPQVMLEAMAAGIPVIATDLAQHREVLADGELGRLVSTRDEFADAIAELSDEHANRALGTRARAATWERHGNWDSTAQRYVAFYQDLLQAR